MKKFADILNKVSGKEQYDGVKFTLARDIFCPHMWQLVDKETGNCLRRDRYRNDIADAYNIKLIGI